MIHAVIADFTKNGKRWVQRLADNFFTEPAGQISDIRQFVRCKWSGRLDEIHICTNETNIRGIRFDGQILPIDDSFAVDGLLIYVRRNIKPISRRRDAVDDPETLFWHWASETLYRPSDNRPCFAACVQSIGE
jgi:hypothetical protein